MVKIEHIVGGRVLGVPQRFRSGVYKCHHQGQNMHPVLLTRLEDVADFLRTHPGSGVRMTPKGSRITEDIYIDGLPR